MSQPTERVTLARIGAGLTREIRPGADERAAIAAELSLEALPAFEASVSVEPRSRGWLVSGRVVADVVQTCSVSAESLPAHIDERFEVVVLDEAPDDDALPDLGEVELDIATVEQLPDVAEDGVVDLAAYAVEHLALSLDPYPRKPGAVFEPPVETPPSPFAVLAKFQTRKDDQSEDG